MEQDRETSGNATADLQLSWPTSAPTALGLAVAHMMTKPAFASLPFGDWSRVLVGQINRGHYAFVLDGAKRRLHLKAIEKLDAEATKAWSNTNRRKD